MSTIYKSVIGDTFESIARKKYGDALEAWRISSANPDISDNIPIDSEIVVPDYSVVYNDNNSFKGDGKNSVAIIIKGINFRHFESFSFGRYIDTLSTVSFTAPIDIITKEYRELFIPFTYPSIQVYIENKLVFTGVIVEINPSLNQIEKKVTVSAYSKAGVISDCTASSKMFPVEFYDCRIMTIAKRLLSPFGINAILSGKQGSPFLQVALNVDDRILTFLVKLAKYRNIMIVDNELGDMIFYTPEKSGTTLSRFIQDVYPLVSIETSFNARQYYSHITGIEPMTIGLDRYYHTEKNKKLSNVFRPLVFVVPDTYTADIKQAVKSKVSRMFGNMASYKIVVSTWRDNSGNLFYPGGFINLLAPDAMIYKGFDFQIKSVHLYQNNVSETATIGLSIPGSFSGVVPETLPWEV